jgi:hypothetical protein
MSRSIKKHCGGILEGKSPNTEWKKNTSRIFRRKVRACLKILEEDPDKDIIFPKYDEIADPWDAPSDGLYGILYRNFNEFFRKIILREMDSRFHEINHPEYCPNIREIPTKKELWKMWKIDYIGK